MHTPWNQTFQCGKFDFAFALGLFSLLLVAFARAQTSQFAFDQTGNLFAQSGEAISLPLIVAQPQTRIVIPGESASFSVVLADCSGLAYEWLFNGTPIPGASNDSLLISNASSLNEGQYSVIVSNAVGPVLSIPASLFIDSDGDGLPDSWEIAHFGHLGETAAGDFDFDGVCNLQEYLDGTDPTNALSALYHIAVSTDGGTVIVSPDQPGYTNGQVVTLTAIGSAVFPFHAWTGDVLTRSDTISLTMTNNKTLFAHFRPIAFTWAAGDGDWNMATNWLPSLVPGSNDNARIISPGTVTLNNDADLGDFNLGSAIATLTGTGTLAVRGTCDWVAGTMSGSGRTCIAPGGALNIACAFGVAGVTLIDRTLENGGLAVWTGPGIIHLGGVITNRPGGTFICGNAAFLSSLSGAPRFDNAGTFITSSTGTLTFSLVPFNNYGAAQIQAGTLLLNGGGLNNGTLELPAGTLLNLGSGNFSASAASSITGAGQFMVSAGTATLAGTVRVTDTNTFSNGTANLTGNYSYTNDTLVISGGAVNFDGTGLVTPAVINLSGGSLGGGQSVTAGSAMNWTGGDLVGSGGTIIPAGARLTMALPGGAAIVNRTLDNSGSATWTGPGFVLMNNAVITNRPGASFELRNDTPIFFGGGAPRFDNAGTFRKAVGGTTSFNTVAFNNYNTARIQAGTLFLNGGGLNNGTVDVPAGALLQLGSGNFTASAASSIAGAGQFLVSAGTATLAGTVRVTDTNTFSNGTANLTGNYFCTNNTLVISGGAVNFDGTGAVFPAIVNLSNGSLGGGQTVTVGNRMSWTGGDMVGAGRTLIPTGAALTMALPAGVTITSRTLENAGTVTWTGAGFLSLNHAVLTNRPGALFDVQTASSVNFAGGTPRFDNAGTFRKSAGGTTAFNTVRLNNFGTVDIRAGILAVNGDYISGSNATLNCALAGTGAGTNYGQLQVLRTATLAGTVSVNLTNGFSPATNDAFTLVSAGACSNAFANFSFPADQIGMVLSHTPTAVIAIVTNVSSNVPQLRLLPPLVSGSNITLLWMAVSNVTYRVEFNPDLNPANWNGLPGDVTAVTHVAAKEDTLTPSNRFYRVRVVP